MRPNSCSIQAPTWRVDRGKLAATQAFKLSSCAALIKPALPPISKLVRPSIPPCSKSLRQPRIVSSSSNNALATSRQLHPSFKSTRAFARRVIRLAAAPSRANAISLLRSSSPRKPPRIMPPSESDQQRNARNFPEPSMSRGIAKNIRKVGVVAKNSYGFIGNRMMDPYAREAEHCLLEGATPEQVDGALEDFGMAMGILAVFDLAGVEVGPSTRRERKHLLPKDPGYYRCSDMLVERGWLGQKTGRGYYRYDNPAHKSTPDPEAAEMFWQEG